MFTSCLNLWWASWSSHKVLDELILKVSFLMLVSYVNNKHQNWHARVNLTSKICANVDGKHIARCTKIDHQHTFSLVSLRVCKSLWVQFLGVFLIFSLKCVNLVFELKNQIKSVFYFLSHAMLFLSILVCFHLIFDIWAWAFDLKCLSWFLVEFLPLKVLAPYFDLEPCFGCAKFDANVGGV
jgi:hypothetical protein